MASVVATGFIVVIASSVSVEVISVAPSVNAVGMVVSGSEVPGSVGDSVVGIVVSKDCEGVDSAAEVPSVVAKVVTSNGAV